MDGPKTSAGTARAKKIVGAVPAKRGPGMEITGTIRRRDVVEFHYTPTFDLEPLLDLNGGKYGYSIEANY